MKIHREFQQNSFEWLCARAGLPTASEFDALVSPTFEIRKGQTPASYLAKKLAEKWIGGPLPGADTLDMEFGKILEDEAKPFFTLETGKEIESVGLITTDDRLAGCSPDGLIGDDCGIEIKCPAPHTHCKYLMDGGLPPEYAAQVHGSMYVTGYDRWMFMSYRRKFPPLIIEVRRDYEIQDAIAGALSVFHGKLQAAYERLCDLNGGPPKQSKPERYDNTPAWMTEPVGVTP